MKVVHKDSGRPIANLPPKMQKARELLDLLFRPVATELDQNYVIPDGSEQKIIDYALNMLCKKPDMNPSRIVRKTAQYFRLVRKIPVLK